MANYANLTLDTIAPSGVSVLINDGELKTSSSAVTLKISCSDEDTSSYQMKIWGVLDSPTGFELEKESQADWQTYQPEINVSLLSGDGTKTVYVKIRDDVYNESSVASASIVLSTSVPTVDSFVLDKTKVSLIDGMNTSYGTVLISEDIDACKLMLVESIDAAYNSTTNISIGTANGSGIAIDGETGSLSTSNLEYDGNGTAFNLTGFSINAKDISAASPGDGVKILKLFVRSSSSGLWSV